MTVFCQSSEHFKLVSGDQRSNEEYEDFKREVVRIALSSELSRMCMVTTLIHKSEPLCLETRSCERKS